MFGSTAAVCAFNQVSRSLWFLINVLLKVPSAVYFDDYPMFSLEKAAAETDAVGSDFLDLLGWRHDRTGPKGKPSPSFDVLGLALDLSSLRQAGVVTLKKQGRKSRQIFFKNSGDSKSWQHEFVRSSGAPWPLKFCNWVLFGESLKVCLL